MVVVFYVGPRNSYGKKEQNPTFWLKLFLLTKQSSSTFTWMDAASERVKSLHLSKDDRRIWVRYLMSYVVNGIGFLFLMHVLPIQVAGQSSIIGVVFRAVGMIYLVDLDDITGTTLTLASQDVEAEPGSEAKEYGSISNQGHGMDDATFEAEKQKIIQEALQDAEKKLQALARGERFP